MEIISVGDNGLFVVNASELYTKQLENRLFLFDIRGVKDYARTLIDATFESIREEHQLESRLELLASTQLFNMVVITNRPVSKRHIPQLTDLTVDNYIRYSGISISRTVADTTTNVPIGVTSIIDDEHVSAIIKRISPMTCEKMDSLEKLNIIRRYTYIEFPWVNRFTFTQPKGSPTPEDYKVTL